MTDITQLLGAREVVAGLLQFRFQNSEEFNFLGRCGNDKWATGLFGVSAAYMTTLPVNVVYLLLHVLVIDPIWPPLWIRHFLHPVEIFPELHFLWARVGS